MRLSPTSGIAFLGAALLLVSAPAAAQSDAPAAAGVGVGAGVAFPFHSDFSFRAFEWVASIRFPQEKHLLVEIAIDQWRHKTTHVVSDITLRDATGVIGHTDEIRTEDATTVTVIGVNALVTGTRGRMRVSAGGGAGVIRFADRYEVDVTGCTSPAPQHCQEYTRRDSRYDLSVQATADVELALRRRLSAFGRFNLVVPVEGPFTGHFGFVAGVRMGLK